MTPQDYAERATEHRPRTIDALRESAKQMLREGHSYHGIAAALGVAVEQVRHLVGQCESCE